MKPLAIVFLAFSLTASLAFAGAGRSAAEPGVLETLSGRIDVVNQGRTMVMKLAAGSGDRWFYVETDSLTPLPKSFSASSAEAFHWQGHLLLLVPQEKRALHFSIRDFRPARPSPWTKQDLGPVRDAASLEALLAGYEVTRVPTATMLASSQGPRALEAIPIEGSAMNRDPRDKVFYQPTDPGGGNGNCGTTCSTSCADGSSCTATCASPRCASCSCPASCTCSFR